MPRIPEQIIDDIRMRADIGEIVGAYVPLKPRGKDLWGLCPFHREKTPSFKVNVDHQAYYCFGCKKSGNVFTFVQEHENVDFVGAVEILARRVGVRLPDPDAAGGGPAQTPEQRRQKQASRDKEYALLDDIAEWYAQLLQRDEGAVARAYLEQRGIDAATVERFGLGYAPDAWDAALTWGSRHGYSEQMMIDTGMLILRDEGQRRVYDRFRNRLMFPIHDALGRIVGFSGRVLEGDAQAAKYLNTPETRLFRKNRLLYALDKARRSFRDTGYALVCEGQLDVIACHRAGVTAAVSAQGTAFTENHARLLRRYTNHVRLAFDADTAGQKAAVRTVSLLFDVEVEVSVVTMPPGQDPDGVFRDGGAEALTALMDTAQDAVTFVFEAAARETPIDTPRGKAAVADAVLDVVMGIRKAVTRVGYAQWLAAELRVPESSVFDALNRKLKQMRKRRVSRRKRQQDGQSDEPAPAPAPLEIATREGKALALLLDLAVHVESAAMEIAALLPEEALDNSPAAQALNLVLAHTEQGEWTAAIQELTRDDGWLAQPDVARALVDSRITHLDPDGVEDEMAKQRRNAKLNQAIQDCIHLLCRDGLKARITDVQQQLADEKDPDRSRELLDTLVMLERQRRKLPPPEPALA